VRYGPPRCEPEALLWVPSPAGLLLDAFNIGRPGAAFPGGTLSFVDEERRPTWEGWDDKWDWNVPTLLAAAVLFAFGVLMLLGFLWLVRHAGPWYD
jgi:hypothetical protein